MTLYRKHSPSDDQYINPAYYLRDVGDARAAGWLLDEDLSQIMGNVRDPFATYAEPNAYHTFIQTYEVNACMDSVVAGISERLGYPPGLSFDEVFVAIK